jgi:glycosyltransferase involved in cell wall biosynthesis
VSVIPPFAHSLEDPNNSNGEPCVLFVGRLVATKGVKDVVRAWELSGTNLPLVIAGAGPERGQINNPNIEWVGWLNPRELSGLYRRAKALLIAPRWQEPFGIVGLEAKSFGLPVVTWESGGVAEWDPEVLVPWGDVQALSAGLAKVLEGGIKSCPTKRGNITANMQSLRSLYQRTIRNA